MRKIILATTSKVRKEGFSNLLIPFSAEDPGVDEYSGKRPIDPEKLTSMLAKKKAEAVAKNHKDAIIFGFDSVGFFQGEIMEKPKDEKEAFERLKKYSGTKHSYITGICLIDIKNDKVIERNSKTEVHFRKITDDEIIKFIREKSHFMNTSLSYIPNKYYSSTFISKIEGSMSDLMYAMPLNIITELLEEIDFYAKK